MDKTEHDFTGAEWWWPAGLVPVPDQYADFASDIMLPSAPDQARLFLTCGTWYTLWVNGEWIIHGPAREVAPWQYYNCVDLLPHLKAGLNRFRIRAYHFGVSNQSHEACLAGLMIKGRIAGGTWDIDLSNRELWRAAVSSGFLPDAPRLHPCNFFGEHIDLSVDPCEWLKTDFEALGPAPAVVAKHPLPGRDKLISSDLPVMTGDTWRAMPHSSSHGWKIFDFGREVFGFLSADIESDRTVTCQIIHGESLTREGIPDYRFSGGDFREILELPCGRRQWESFEKRAMRYLALPDSVHIHQLSIREYHRPLKEVWRTAPEAAHLSGRDYAIVAAAARTVTLCCDDLLNDCPRRERAQYNDPSLYMDAFPRLFGTWEPYRRWLHQFLRGAGPDGVLRACYPGPAGNKLIIPDFSILFAMNVRRYLEATGDIETARACFSAALAGVTAFECYADEEGLLTDVPGWVFLCNSFELAKQPRSSGLNALWAASWKHLAFLAGRLGDNRSEVFNKKSETLRASWRECFLRDGRVLDSDSSPVHQQRRWWNYHYEADRGYFTDGKPELSSFILRVKWCGAARRLAVAAAGTVRVWCDGILLLQESAKNPWCNPHPFQPWECELPAGFDGGELLLEVGWNSIDWEVYITADGGTPGEVRAGEVPSCNIEGADSLADIAVRPSTFRPWYAPRFSQISAGYAVDCGMLEPDEAVSILRACLREQYYVPWLKRSTPLICTQTLDAELIAGRAVVCNTPHSLFFFCRALESHGMRNEAQNLCRRLFGKMMDEGATALWEEFAPRSSQCHAWGAMCVSYMF